MINSRIIARVLSLLLITEGILMLVCAGISFLNGENAVSAFLYSALITLITGVIVFTPLRKEERISGIQEGYLIVTGSWVLFALFGTLPFLFSGTADNFADAFFESMSGLTTTGATIMNDVESLPRGILFWRSISQWIGGAGIIIISLSIFPVVRSITIQIAASEFTGYQIEKIHPRIIETARRLLTIYAGLTLAESVLLVIGGMSPFEALCNSFTTMSTGGFSTRNNSMASFSSPYMMTIITVFMFLAATNPTIIYFALKGKPDKITGNNEFVFYTVICIIFITISSIILYFRGTGSVGEAISTGAFHTVSIISTTGFYTQNFALWGYPLGLIIFILMFTGGTAGSTSGGIKLIRLLLVTRNSRQEMKRLIHPSAFLPVRLNKHIIPQSKINNVLVFLTLYFFIVCLSTFVMAAMGYDLMTSFSTAASMLGNIGPSLGTFSPFSNYSGLPVFGKYFLSFLMLLGRLELLTVLILFTRSFYRN